MHSFLITIELFVSVEGSSGDFGAEAARFFFVLAFLDCDKTMICWTKLGSLYSPRLIARNFVHDALGKVR